MSFDQVVALVVLTGVVAALVWGRLRSDVVALAGAAALLITGTIRPTEVQGAFGSPAIIALASLFVIAYALSKDQPPSTRNLSTAPHTAIGRSVLLTVALVVIGSLPCIMGGDLLPEIVLRSGGFTVKWLKFVALPVSLLSTGAILLWKRQRSMLDLWLMVVMFVFLIEMPTSYYPDPMRFSPGWYAARLFGFLGSSLVLVVLLYEIETLYVRLLGSVLAQRREREARLMTGDAVAASIAHEVKQPLTAMITSADAGFRFLDRPTPNLARAKEAFALIAADGHRAGAVVENIRANFRMDERTRVSLDVNELIREALVLERGDLERNRILVKTEANQQLPQVRGNRIQIQQVLVNLITNAIDAMAAREQPRVLSVRSEQHETDRIVVSVADTGTGVGSLDTERIFNPLFTTKSHGMGMGLSICRAIVEAHDGRLWFVPNTPHGAVFRFSLRASSAAMSSA